MLDDPRTHTVAVRLSTAEKRRLARHLETLDEPPAPATFVRRILLAYIDAQKKRNSC